MFLKETFCNLWSIEDNDVIGALSQVDTLHYLIAQRDGLGEDTLVPGDDFFLAQYQMTTSASPANIFFLFFASYKIREAHEIASRKLYAINSFRGLLVPHTTKAKNIFKFRQHVNGEVTEDLNHDVIQKIAEMIGEQVPGDWEGRWFQMTVAIIEKLNEARSS